MKRHICFLLCACIIVSLFSVNILADSDEIISIMSACKDLGTSKRLDYLIHNNELYICEDDAAMISNLEPDKEVDHGFYRKFPDLYKQEDGSWIIKSDVLKGSTLKPVINDLYSYDGKDYYPIESIMKSFGTSYFYNQNTCTILYFPSYTFKEIRALCIYYASSNGIATAGDSFDSFNGHMAIIMATAYDVFMNCKFISVLTNDYASDNYEDIIFDIVYSSYNEDNVFLDLAIEGDSLMEDLSSVYRLGDYDPDFLESLCEMYGYDLLSINKSYQLLDETFTAFSLGDFLRIIDTSQKKYMSDGKYINAVYYGLEHPGDDYLREATERILLFNMNNWTYEDLLLDAVNQYIKSLKDEAITETASLITGIEYSYYKIMTSICKLLLNNFIPVDKAVKDCIDIKYCGVMQDVAYRNIHCNPTSVATKYSTVFYLQLSEYIANRLGFSDIVTQNKLKYRCLLSIPDITLDNSIKTPKISVIQIKSDYKKAELLSANEIVLYHIAYMYSNSGNDHIDMCYKDANSDGFKDLLIIPNNGELYSAIIPGGDYQNSIYITDLFFDSNKIVYCPTYGAFVSTIEDTNAPDNIKENFFNIVAYDFTDDSWNILFSKTYDDSIDGLTRYFILGEEVSYEEFIRTYEDFLCDISGFDSINENYFSILDCVLDISSQELFNELNKYSIFNSSYVGDLDDDGVSDYVLISQLNENEDNKRVPYEVNVVGHSEYNCFWDDACLYILSNYGDTTIKWSSFSELLKQLSSKNLPLPDGVYDVQITRLSSDFASENFANDVFDNKSVEITVRGVIEFENDYCLSLSEGDEISLENFGINTNIVIDSVDEFGIGISDDNSVDIISIYNSNCDSEWIASTYSDYPVYWSQYLNTVSLADIIGIEFEYLYYDSDDSLNIQVIHLTDLNDCVDYLRTGYHDCTEITVSNGEIIKIRIYSNLSDIRDTPGIHIAYNEHPQWFKFTYDQMDAKIYDHVKSIQDHDIIIHENLRSVNYQTHTYSVDINYFLNDSDFGDEGYQNGNPIPDLGTVTIDLETGKAEYKDWWGHIDSWNIYE